MLRKNKFLYSLSFNSLGLRFLACAPLFSINWCRTVGPHQSQPKADQPLAEPSSGSRHENCLVTGKISVSSNLSFHQKTVTETSQRRARQSSCRNAYS